MTKITVLVKFPGQPLCYMQVPTDRIEKIYSSIAGLQSTEVNTFSLYRGFYYILLDGNREKKKLPPNMTAYLVNPQGDTSVLDIRGVFVICKLPTGLTGPMTDMTPQDAEQVVKLLRN